MITVENLTKRFGAVTAVQELSFDVPAGVVTGFIGPNGAGKSTTLRVILGLDRPTSGRALVNGVEYARLTAPAREIGAVLDPHAVHPGRTARDQLRWAATAAGVSTARIATLLDQVGLAHAGSRKIGALSLGMRQRLAIAVGFLGEPGILVLDEPLNGLDPEGIVWLRTLLKNHAARGGTVLISSHLLNELEETADRVVLIAAGRLVANLTMAELTARTSGATRVVTDDGVRFAETLERAGATVHPGADGALQVNGIDSRAIGRIAFEHGVALVELTPMRGGLEQTFLRLTNGMEPAT
ncbi:ATP-binding cassette domain-containing protein [Nonomuraea sp. K274]|uniref:ATP-binding cassette domain-containing protein n=1 Tax=Nonomuraea cypriaca TaxID=1187855 RepID=A0A931A810_9ACTN|nr:ATP-binding cassette domain-containing protein [Nonomuraea cypriaca]MBF8185688.1 ATP-binding cassette domain-containing protein [Nonomuraea cypriaca]